MKRPGKRVLWIVGLVGTLAAGWLTHLLYREAYYRGAVPPVPGLRDAVIFIVTDNVRADHTGLCGYGRPTTPTLSSMAVEPGAVHTCRAYAPGSWTLPSHASYFTGESVIEHGAHEYTGTVKNPHGTGIITRHLQAKETTLAETFSSRGYQTILLAGNPVVGKGSGLGQGFDWLHAAKQFGDFDYPDLVARLRRILKQLDPMGGPLFLTVNLAEAHRPWKAIPAKHPFLGHRKEMQYFDEKEDGEWSRFFAGSMSETQRKRFLATVTDVYDYGVERADDGVRNVLQAVRDTGWCRARCRIVVTSDHGEFIGEHALIDHGFYSWEENANVYIVGQGLDVASLPEPISALAVYSLVKDGRLPDALPAIEQWAWPHVRRAIHTGGRAFTSMSVARWTGWTKQLWMDGHYFAFDLRTDPGELGPESIDDPDPDFAALRGILEHNATLSGDDPADMLEALKAAGYME